MDRMIDATTEATRKSAFNKTSLVHLLPPTRPSTLKMKALAKNRNKQTKFPVVRSLLPSQDASTELTWTSVTCYLGTYQEDHAEGRGGREGCSGDTGRHMCAHSYLKKMDEILTCSYTIPFAAKALELFLAMLVEEAASVTLQRNSKRVEPYHL